MNEVTFDPKDLEGYLFHELLEEGFVPTKEEIHIITEITLDFILQLVDSLGVQVVYEGDED